MKRCCYLMRFVVCLISANTTIAFVVNDPLNLPKMFWLLKDKLLS